MFIKKTKNEEMVMKKHIWLYPFFVLISIMFTGCASNMAPYQNDDMDTYTDNSDLPLYQGQAPYSRYFDESRYASSLPSSISSNEKTILIDPNSHAWGAYRDGNLVKGGIATVGADYCEDVGRPCRTKVGTFRIYSMGGAECVSRTYPVGEGGALMPYCMFFSGGQSLHGTPDQMMVARNMSHGCVRMRIPSAEWIRYNFATVGTKVVVLPYNY
jgi:hypothetical protein